MDRKTVQRFLSAATRRINPGEAFDLDETPNPGRAAVVWQQMQDLGFAKVADHARCGFEMVPGRFVSLTPAAYMLAGQPTPSKEKT